MNNLSEYIEHLAALHPEIQHGEECHFSNLADDSRTRQAATMHYPCVVMDSDHIAVAGQTGAMLLVRSYTVMFLTHVGDSGNNAEVAASFAQTERIMLDFIRRMNIEKKSAKYRFLNRFSPVGSEAQRVYMKDDSLFGWALEFEAAEPFTDLDCDGTWACPCPITEDI